MYAMKTRLDINSEKHLKYKLQMLISQHESTNLNSQGNISSPEANASILVGSGQCNVAESQDKHFKTSYYEFSQGL